MLRDALIRHEAVLRAAAPGLEGRLATLECPDYMSPLQALCLAAFSLELRPDVVIDLGTGNGNSTAAFATARETHGQGRIHTFDFKPYWEEFAASRLKKTGLALDCVESRVGDLTRFDFRPLLAEAERVLVFWDAHGFAVAQHVLGHIMPAIVDKPHVVICHDISDNRFLHPSFKEYGGKRFWRGMGDYYKSDGQTHYGNIGWATSIVDQVIPIVDFCWRNDLELHSADYELNEWRKTAFLAGMSEPYRALAHLAYFSMNETSARRFPALL